MAKKLMLHISPVSNRDSIKKNGLRLNSEGMLFLTEPLEVEYPFFFNQETQELEPHWISIDRLLAWKELYLPEYDVWAVAVNPKDLEPDDVAEWEARWNHIYRKPIPNPNLLVSGRKLNTLKPWEE